MGMNCLYCCQFAMVILVPSGIVDLESAEASAALAVRTSARQSSKADAKTSKSLAIVKSRLIMGRLSLSIDPDFRLASPIWTGPSHKATSCRKDWCPAWLGLPLCARRGGQGFHWREKENIV